ncbi:MAG TPA: ABC transporter ATP-binding protein [Candidatus Limnocylindrales bacterium]|nr:ABC transporter ATP-binding protein [Candidatus Limnocylindrales bacterium]
MSAPDLAVDEVRAPALEMRGITKRYPGVIANDHIDLDVRPGEIHALLGENGAGKTTLMNILYGLARPDEGEILIDGTAVRIADPTDAISRGINMVHQHFMLVPVMTVAENILLGEETMANPWFLDRRESKRRIVELGQRFGFEIDPDVKVGELSVGWQQRVEILKALYRNARVLVLDEPTAVLTPQETLEIFAVLRRLAENGHSIVFISHKLYEVLEIADRITVIRRGRVVGQRIPKETNEEDLAALMVGRDVQLVVDRGESNPTDARLTVSGLHVADDRGTEVVRGVDFDVRSGEIFGIAGVAGNGQDELVEAIVGLRQPSAGTVTLDGRDVTNLTTRAMTNLGVGYVPADRHRFGLVLNFTVADNLVLTDYYRAPYARGFLRDEDAVAERGKSAIAEYDIRTPSAEVNAGTLSGGNQQKVVVAREMDGDLRLLVLDQPTRGLDVGSIEFIHRRAIRKRDAGTAVLLVSAELDEVLELSDRVAVMYRGQIVAIVDGRTADRNEVGILMATGVRQEAAVASGQITAEEAAAAAAAETTETPDTPDAGDTDGAAGPAA